jgi:PleD family two-component response regulator
MTGRRARITQGGGTTTYDAHMTRVLLAEDDQAISEPLARALRREGYDVEVCEDGPGALESATGTACRAWTGWRCAAACATRAAGSRCWC